MDVSKIIPLNNVILPYCPYCYNCKTCQTFRIYQGHGTFAVVSIPHFIVLCHVEYFSLGQPSQSILVLVYACDMMVTGSIHLIGENEWSRCRACRPIQWLVFCRFNFCLARGFLFMGKTVRLRRNATNSESSNTLVTLTLQNFLSFKARAKASACRSGKTSVWPMSSCSNSCSNRYDVASRLCKSVLLGHNHGRSWSCL